MRAEIDTAVKEGLWELLTASLIVSSDRNLGRLFVTRSR